MKPLARKAGPRHARRVSVALGVGGLLLAASGCSMFRAQLGGGIGIGADLKIPGLVHTGLSAGQYMNVGIRYDDPELSHDASATLVAWHWEGRQSHRKGEGRAFLGEHSCWAGVPPLTETLDKDHLSVWDFEIGVNLLVIDVRLGFNPVRLDQGGHRRAEPAPVTRPLPRAPAAPAPPRRPNPAAERDPLMPGAVDPPIDAGQ